MALCPTCGASNREGRKFCAECGRGFTAACQACGAANQPDEHFCGECGAPLSTAAVVGSEPSAEPHDAPSAERRLVSVLFADLVGFTALSESRDAEEVRELLSRYFDTCRRLIDAVRRHGREVHRRRGDGRLGHTDGDRGRRRARSSGRARSRRRGLRARGRGRRAGPSGTRGRAHRRGSGDDRRRGPGHGRGRSRQHRLAGAVGRRAWHRLRRRVHPRATEQTIAYEDAGAFELKGKAELTRSGGRSGSSPGCAAR